MALNIELLAKELEDIVDSLRGEIHHRDYKRRYYLALAKVIIEHIQTNSELTGSAGSYSISGKVK